MKALSEWLSDYAADHQHPTNQKIHRLCVPAILFSTLGLLGALPRPLIMGVSLNWAYVLVALSSAFYLCLSWRWALRMFLVTAGSSWAFALIEAFGVSLTWPCAIVFALSWGAQFYGHQLEGQRPAFLKDILYLLIGPLWVVHELSTALRGSAASEPPGPRDPETQRI